VDSVLTVIYRMSSVLWLLRERDNGYRRVMLVGVGICTIVGAPAFYLINFGHWWSACVGQGIFAVSLALYGSCLPAFVVQQVVDMILFESSCFCLSSFALMGLVFEHPSTTATTNTTFIFQCNIYKCCY
jgi:hypothetical protein